MSSLGDEFPTANTLFVDTPLRKGELPIMFQPRLDDLTMSKFETRTALYGINEQRFDFSDYFAIRPMGGWGCG